MARFQDREKARKLRKEGKTYSEIKRILRVSKSTLSLWLRDMPLSDEQMRTVRDWNPRRIENYRITTQRKREARLSLAYQKAKKDIGILSKRELFLGGLFLYWGEGAKSMRGTTLIANTDPDIVYFFLQWLLLMEVDIRKVKIKLHLYSDMDIETVSSYWSERLGIPRSQFRKPYVKTSTLSGLTYKNGFGHGTCNVIYGDIALWEYVLMALKHFGELGIRVRRTT